MDMFHFSIDRPSRVSHVSRPLVRVCISIHYDDTDTAVCECPRPFVPFQGPLQCLISRGNSTTTRREETRGADLTKPRMSILSVSVNV